MRQFLTLFLSILCVTTGVCAAPVDALPPDFSGSFEFRIADGTVLTATLTLPASAAPSPVIVVLHGGDGLGELEAGDAKVLQAKGFAVVVVDSFAGRQVRTGMGNGPRPRPQARIADAYAILAIVRTHPAIDGSRAFLLGRSHGGATAMMAATHWAKAKYSPNGPGFTGHFALYPPCTVTAPEYDSLSAPLRLHLGSADDYTPASQCQAIAARMQSLNQPVTVTVYADAHHAFDVVGPVSYMSQYPSVAKCSFVLPALDAPVPVDELGKCIARGGTIGGNSKAAALLRENLLTQLESLRR